MEENGQAVGGDARAGMPGDAVRGARDGILDPSTQVRAADLEPYVGLRYVARLFRIIALIILMLLVAEVAVGLYQEGWQSVWGLLSEASRLLVLAGLLWGAGDLMGLLIDIGHDVRATRILIGRQAAQQMGDPPRVAPGRGAPLP
ncbi:MAG TPA: hypothetical protein VFS05_13415 [Gemmatimonadaceae bacterium]|nr:hypothetical protein [Gemmatimonadaceae bacterium]